MLRTKNIDLTNGPIFSSLILYSVPLILSGILQIFFNAADLAVVGNFAGTAATAAVGATGAFINLVVHTVMGLSNGVNIVLARAIGARDHEKTSKVVHTAMTFSLLAGIVVAIIGALLSPMAMDITKCPIDSKQMAIDYLMIYFAGCPAIFVYNFGSAILRTKGDTRRPLNFLLLSGIVNVILNLIFVIVFNMTADGVALATTISQYLAAFLTVNCLMNQEDSTRLDLKALRIIKTEFLGIVKYGLPSGLTNAVYSIANIQIQSAVNSFGSSYVAGSSAVSSLEGFVQSTYVAMNSAAVAFVGQNIGAGNKKRIKRIIFWCITVSLAFSLTLGFGIYLIGDPFYKIYIPKDPVALSAAAEKASIMLTLYFILALSQTVGAISQAFGYSLYISMISIFGVFGIRTIWMNLIYPEIGTFSSIMWCYPFSWAIISIANSILLFVAYNRYIKKGQLK